MERDRWGFGKPTDGWMDGTKKKKRGARRSAVATRDSGAVANA